MRIGNKFGAFSLLASIAAASNAFAADNDHHALRLSAYVPTVCTVMGSGDEVTIIGANAEIGDIGVLCNSSQGYQVWLDYDAARGATLFADGVSFLLSGNGSILISESQLAGSQTIHLSLDRGESQLIPGFSVRIVAR